MYCFFGLPSHWIYVVYKDGHSMNVENADGLTRAEAVELATRWHGYKGHGDVVAVRYCDSRDNVLKTYEI